MHFYQVLTKTMHKTLATLGSIMAMLTYRSIHESFEGSTHIIPTMAFMVPLIYVSPPKIFAIGMILPQFMHWTY